MKIAVINGVNLGRLGKREPEIYGHTTLEEINKALQAKAPDVEFAFFQSNHEGAIIDKIEALTDLGYDYAIINPAAFTHTSVALKDCIAASSIKFIEVHISNIYKREEFRHKSFTASQCEAVISGMGIYGYTAALDYFLNLGK